MENNRYIFRVNYFKTDWMLPTDVVFLKWASFLGTKFVMINFGQVFRLSNTDNWGPTSATFHSGWPSKLVVSQSIAWLGLKVVLKEHSNPLCFSEIKWPLVWILDFGLSGTLSSSQDFKFALANLQKNFEKLAAKTDTNKLDDFLKLEVNKMTTTLQAFQNS